MRSSFPIILLLGSIFSLLLGGCAQRYEMHVDALKRESFVPPPAKSWNYVLVSSDPEINPRDLRFQEIARVVDAALATKGYRLAADPQNADLILFVDTVLSEPISETREISEPIYRERPGYLRTVRVPVYGSNGKVEGFTYSQIYIPSDRHFAGYMDRQRQITVYQKNLELSARLNSGKEALGDEVWNVRVSAKDEARDLREYLPYMLSAALPYIGERTSQEETVVVKEEDPVATSLKK